MIMEVARCCFKAGDNESLARDETPTSKSLGTRHPRSLSMPCLDGGDRWLPPCSPIPPHFPSSTSCNITRYRGISEHEREREEARERNKGEGKAEKGKGKRKEVSQRLNGNESMSGRCTRSSSKERRYGMKEGKTPPIGAVVGVGGLETAWQEPSAMIGLRW